MNRLLVLAAAWALVACSRTQPKVDLSGDVTGGFTVGLSDASTFAIQSYSACGDIVVMDRYVTIDRYDGGQCDPCVRGCADIEGDRWRPHQPPEGEVVDAGAMAERIRKCVRSCRPPEFYLQHGATVIAQTTESGAIYAGNVTPSTTNWSATSDGRTLWLKTQTPRDGGRGEEYAFDGTDGNACVQACKDGLVSEWADAGAWGGDASIHHAVACVQRCGFKRQCLRDCKPPQ